MTYSYNQICSVLEPPLPVSREPFPGQLSSTVSELHVSVPPPQIPQPEDTSLPMNASTINTHILTAPVVEPDNNSENGSFETSSTTTTTTVNAYTSLPNSTSIYSERAFEDMLLRDDSTANTLNGTQDSIDPRNGTHESIDPENF